MEDKILRLENFYKTGNTLSYEFRIDQLYKLQDAINKYEDKIMSALRIDMKKPSFEAYLSEYSMIQQELDDAISNLKSWMEEKKVPTPFYLKPGKSYIKPSPKGIVLIISPWNYPFLLSLSPLIASIAAGNCTIVKTSSKASYSSALISKILEETFEDDYILSLKLDYESIDKLIRSNRINHLFFTGSQEAGKKLAKSCSSQLIPYTLELGGKSPVIVDDTTDLSLASKKIAWAKFLNLGQTCIAPDYLIIKEGLEEEFLDLIIGHIENFYGNEVEKSPDYGRIINKDQFKRIQRLLGSTQILYGGKLLEDDLFISPTITRSKLDEDIMKEEIFGPVLPLISYRENIEIIPIINKNPNPLALYLFTEDEALVEYIVNGVDFGGASINDTLSHMANTNLPFGGVGQSGIGHYHSIYGFLELSQLKSIFQSKTGLDIDMKYPPYTRTKEKLGKFFLK